MVLAGLVPGFAKPGQQVADDVALEVRRPPRFVSRGGEKLAHALDALGVDPAGKDCLDLGASTGGFTDCLLQRGATRVVALDVGYGQLHPRLRADERVTVVERVNARGLVRLLGDEHPDTAEARRRGGVALHAQQHDAADDVEDRGDDRERRDDRDAEGPLRAELV